MVLLSVYIFAFGFGVLIGYLLKSWRIKRISSGTIVVHQEPDKRVYSLILDEYPEKLELRKVVVFKVDTSEESSSRE